MELDEYACYGKTGNDVLASISSDQLDYNDIDPYISFLVLICMAIALRIGFFFYLRIVVL